MFLKDKKEDEVTFLRLVPFGLFLIFLISFSSSFALACIDSDNGRNITVRGEVEFMNDGVLTVNHDKCVMLKDNDLKTMQEYYCNDRGEVKSVYIACKTMCIEGRCVSEAELDDLLGCTDGDSGIHPYVKSNTTGRISTQTSVSLFNDYCVAGNESLLMEYYCYRDEYVGYELIECDAGCSEGRCNFETNVDLTCDGEYFRYFREQGNDVERGIDSSLMAEYEGVLNVIGDGACCENPHACVYDGTCYTNKSGVVDLNGFASEQKDLLVEAGACDFGRWKDCDQSQGFCESVCGFNWTTLGEALFIGEYNREIDDCCGDDYGEFFVKGIDGTHACCDNATDSVSDGICFSMDMTEEEKRDIDEFKRFFDSYMKNGSTANVGMNGTGQFHLEEAQMNAVSGSEEELNEDEYYMPGSRGSSSDEGFMQKLFNWFSNLFS